VIGQARSLQAGVDSLNRSSTSGSARRPSRAQRSQRAEVASFND